MLGFIDLVHGLVCLVATAVRPAVIKSAANAASPEGFQVVIKSAASAASLAAQKIVNKFRKNRLFVPFMRCDG